MMFVEEFQWSVEEYRGFEGIKMALSTLSPTWAVNEQLSWFCLPAGAQPQHLHSRKCSLLHLERSQQQMACRTRCGGCSRGRGAGRCWAVLSIPALGAGTRQQTARRAPARWRPASCFPPPASLSKLYWSGF